MKPKIILSRCFLEPVRYDGGVIRDDFVEKLKNFVDIVDFCPEVDIGLGIPRNRLILLKKENQIRLIQLPNNLDFTEKMTKYAKEVVKRLKDEIEGALLKSKSPSCGVFSSIVYREKKMVGKSNGIFAQILKNEFPFLPIEDEGRLKNPEIRRHFLTKIFAFCEMRKLFKNPSPRALVEFHTKYKFLLLCYNQKVLKELGRIVAESKTNFKEKLSIYREKFYSAFLKRSSFRQQTNVLYHLVGFFSKKIKEKERKHLISLIEKFRVGKIQLRVVIELLKNLALRFEKEYVLFQKYLRPYPEDLEEI